MAHYVTCIYCHKKFDRDRIPFVQVKNKRYAHSECHQEVENSISQEEIDKQELEKYILKLLNISYLDPKIRKQLKQYIEEYNFTYSGILKSLIYFYEVKGNSVDKANGGIGIVPWVYKTAYQYYYSLWEAQQKNINKTISDYIPAVKEITIPIPQVKIKKRQLFTFLDKEE